MAAAAWLIVLWRGGSVVLGVTALVFAIKAADAGDKGTASHPLTLTDPHQRMLLMLIMVAVPWGVLLLLAESWLVEQEQQQEPPSDVKLLVFLFVMEWLLTFITIGMAFPALLADVAATPVRATYQLAADVTACAAGALAAVSAVGLLWVLGSRLRRAQAALQAQA